MKKILTVPTVIVFLITILIAGGCSPAGPVPSEGSKKVKIHLKAVKKDGKKHLKMSDSKKPDIVVVDTLETLVMPGDTVVWELKRFSKIEKIEKIGPNTPGEILNKDAEQIPGTTSFRFIIPDDAPIPSKREKYDITFVDKRGKTWTIDPYLKIPTQQ